jgi:uncharacterized protein
MCLLAATLPSTAFAVSFDCSKASTFQEKMICADSTLSNLDDKLAQTYKFVSSRAVKAAEMQKEQKEWLRNVRNKCTSQLCLVNAYQHRIDALAPQQVQTEQPKLHCPASEEALLGSWENVSGGFFEEMAFDRSESQREFNSWLHHRPEIAGATWKIENCILSIEHASGETMSFTFTVVRVEGDNLYLRENGEHVDAVYKRIKE